MAEFLWGVAEAVRRIGELTPLPPVPDHDPYEKQQLHGESCNRKRLSAVVDGIFDVEEQQRAQTETIIRSLIDQRPGTVPTRTRALSRIPHLHSIREPLPSLLVAQLNGNDELVIVAACDTVGDIIEEQVDGADEVLAEALPSLKTLALRSAQASIASVAQMCLKRIIVADHNERSARLLVWMLKQRSSSVLRRHAMHTAVKGVLKWDDATALRFGPLLQSFAEQSLKHHSRRVREDAQHLLTSLNTRLGDNLKLSSVQILQAAFLCVLRQKYTQVMVTKARDLQDFIETENELRFNDILESIAPRGKNKEVRIEYTEVECGETLSATIINSLKQCAQPLTGMVPPLAIGAPKRLHLLNHDEKENEPASGGCFETRSNMHPRKQAAKQAAMKIGVHTQAELMDDRTFGEMVLGRKTEWKQQQQQQQQQQKCKFMSSQTDTEPLSVLPINQLRALGANSHRERGSSDTAECENSKMTVSTAFNSRRISSSIEEQAALPAAESLLTDKIDCCTGDGGAVVPSLPHAHFELVGEPNDSALHIEAEVRSDATMKTVRTIDTSNEWSSTVLGKLWQFLAGEEKDAEDNMIGIMVFVRDKAVARRWVTPVPHLHPGLCSSVQTRVLSLGPTISIKSMSLQHASAPKIRVMTFHAEEKKKTKSRRPLLDAAGRQISHSMARLGHSVFSLASRPLNVFLKSMKIDLTVNIKIGKSCSINGQIGK